MFITCGRSRLLSSVPSLPEHLVNRVCLISFCGLGCWGMCLVCSGFGSEWASGQGPEVLTIATLSPSLFVWMSIAWLPRNAGLVIFQADPLFWHHRVILSEAVGAHRADRDDPEACPDRCRLHFVPGLSHSPESLDRRRCQHRCGNHINVIGAATTFM